MFVPLSKLVASQLRRVDARISALYWQKHLLPEEFLSISNRSFGGSCVVAQLK